MRAHYWIKHPMLPKTQVCAWCFATDSEHDPSRHESCDRCLAPKLTLVIDENSDERQDAQKEEASARG